MVSGGQEEKDGLKQPRRDHREHEAKMLVAIGLQELDRIDWIVGRTGVASTTVSRGTGWNQEGRALRAIAAVAF